MRYSTPVSAAGDYFKSSEKHCRVGAGSLGFRSLPNPPPLWPQLTGFGLRNTPNNRIKPVKIHKKTQKYPDICALDHLNLSG